MANNYGDKNSAFVKNLQNPKQIVYVGKSSKFRRNGVTGITYVIRSGKPFWVDERDVNGFLTRKFKRAPFLLAEDGKVVLEEKQPLPTTDEVVNEEVEIREPVELESIENNEDVDLESLEDFDDSFDFTDLNGVGKKTSDSLNVNGINSYSDLSMCNPVTLASDVGISEERAEKIVQQARETIK